MTTQIKIEDMMQEANREAHSTTRMLGLSLLVMAFACLCLAAGALAYLASL